MAGVAQAQQEEAKKGRRPGPAVAYQAGLRVVPDFPAGGGGQKNEVKDLARALIANADLAGKSVELVTFAADDRATGSASNKVSALRKEFKGHASGIKFGVGPSQLEPGRVAVYARYEKVAGNGQAPAEAAPAQ